MFLSSVEQELKRLGVRVAAGRVIYHILDEVRRVRGSLPDGIFLRSELSQSLRRGRPVHPLVKSERDVDSASLALRPPREMLSGLAPELEEEEVAGEAEVLQVRVPQMAPHTRPLPAPVLNLRVRSSAVRVVCPWRVRMLFLILSADVRGARQALGGGAGRAGERNCRVSGEHGADCEGGEVPGCQGREGPD